MLQRLLVASAVVLILIASQIFWVRQMRNWVTSLVPSAAWRRRLGIAGLVGYLLLLGYNFPGGRQGAEPTHLTLRAALIQAPFLSWMVCSLLGFLIAILFGLADRVARAARWVYDKVARAGRAVAYRSRVVGGVALPDGVALVVAARPARAAIIAVR